MTFKGELKPFQLEAHEQMLKRGAFLVGFATGLGKTPITIATLELLIDSGDVESILVICPANIKSQWQKQLGKFTDGALVKIIEGTKPVRLGMYRGVKRGDYEYVIMNYEQVVNDWDVVRFLNFDAVICDEVQNLKNFRAKRSLRVKRIDTKFRFGLTAQPIENRPEELFSIMQFVDPEVLGPATIFENTFIVRDKQSGRVLRYKNLPVLRERMSETMARKTRKDVEDQMPALVGPVPIYIDFDVPTKKLYKAMSLELIDLIQSVPHYSTFDVSNHYAGADTDSAQGDIMSRLMCLQMLCDHPKLLEYSADQFDDPVAQAGSAYAAGLRSAGLLKGITAAPKMKEVLTQIEDILKENRRNKIVLFSFFKPMLRLIGESLDVGHAIYTGDLNRGQRDKVLDRFENDKSCRVLLSSDAGGVGIDMPFANYLFDYDLPWSTGKIEQRHGRIDRISSKWPEITMLSFMMRGSIEERKWEMLESKRQISEAWLDGKRVTKQGTYDLTLGTLVDFLSRAS